MRQEQLKPGTGGGAGLQQRPCGVAASEPSWLPVLGARAQYVPLQLLPRAYLHQSLQCCWLIDFCSICHQQHSGAGEHLRLCRPQGLEQRRQRAGTMHPR